MTTTAISAVVPRKRTRVAGRVLSVAPSFEPWVQFEAVIDDSSGSLVLRFLGRSEVPGMSPGAHVNVEGTAMFEGDVLVMLNPLYEFSAPPPRAPL